MSMSAGVCRSRHPLASVFLLTAILASAVAAHAGPDDGTWSQITQSASGLPPSGRMYHAMVHDPVRGRMLVIGGHPEMLNDVWALPLGAPAWQEILPQGTRPSRRFAHVAIYQPSQDRVILFGGFDGSFRNDVWALSLAGTPAWSLIAPAGDPPAGRWSPAAIYDPAGDRMIVFGGHDGTVARNDAWALSLGATPSWTQLDTRGRTPPVRAYAEGVYDAAAGRLIVFGGFDTATQQFFDDTWALTLGRNPVWTELHPSGSPPSPRRHHSAVYDPARRRLVVFGGLGQALSDQAYALTLGPSPSWSVIGGEGTRPSAREGHHAVYDAAHDRMVVFGGYDGRYQNDAWALSLGDASGWSEIPALSPPSARRHHSLALAEGSVVLFGGDAPSALGDTHLLALDGTPQWRRLGAAGGPSPRTGHRAIYDAPRHRVVVFGGHDAAFNADVHALSLATGSWTPVNAAGVAPSGRSYLGMVYDPVRERMIVIGGHPNMLNDVWALPLGTSPVWEKLSPGGTPPSPRFAHVVVYQPNRDRVILFGGFDGVFRNDVWALSLAGSPVWTPIAPTGTPPAGRWSPAAIYDPSRDRMVVFGGADAGGTRNDAWALSLGATPAWTQLAPAGTPPGRRAYTDAVYDAAGNRMILFGGFDTFTQQFNSETWALTWDAPAPQVQRRRAEPLRGRVAISGVRPNPAGNDLAIAFTLADASPASIELLDVAGRRVLARDLAGLGAGDHELRFAEVRKLPPGLYFVRLRQRGLTLTAPVTVAH